MSADFLYQPYYCEENIWHLCQDARFAECVRFAVWIMAPDGYCPLWAQRGAPDADAPIFWDYHVVLFAKRPSNASIWECWDLDSTAALPCPVTDYLRLTFPYSGRIPSRFEPRFRPVPAETYQREFSSNREHMRDEAGNWLRPPPPWPPICQGKTANFNRFRDLRDPIGGTICKLSEVVREFSSAPNFSYP